MGPPGLVPRHLYSLAAIVTAWLLALAAPLGDGLDQAKVYDRQGVDRRPSTAVEEPDHAGVRRWRSLGRWADRIGGWWPARPVGGETWRDRAGALLLGFVAGEGGRPELRRRAVLAAQTDAGAAM